MTDEQEREFQARFQKAIAEFMTPERQAESRRLLAEELEEEIEEHERILADSWALAHTKLVRSAA